jgi:hypothetical protein
LFPWLLRPDVVLAAVVACCFVLTAVSFVFRLAAYFFCLLLLDLVLYSYFCLYFFSVLIMACLMLDYPGFSNNISSIQKKKIVLEYEKNIEYI